MSIFENRKVRRSSLRVKKIADVNLKNPTAPKM
jgi:hypothetical protein